ncbi:hypothetical protein FOMPIDRAFT_1052487 [Fomitopsis schrenkii]|uniref:Uncharacterized protein n=1 Tax=Fomitopsis schrenkii TaxID=2126942 RepID=S8DVV7_FOMSC|nr:hypothetical protein FOMPIDRAFT_1052487 [Fomitopsis schrenkii]
MSLRTSSSSSQSSVSSGDHSIDSYSDSNHSSSSSDMLFGTPISAKGGTGVTQQGHTRQKHEVNRSSWAKEIEGKVSVFDAPVKDFLDVFVPGPKSSKRPSKKTLRGAFVNVDADGKEVEKYPDLIEGLGSLVKGFDAEKRPDFGDGSRCRISFPFEAWGKEQHYTMPDIVMSLPGNTGARVRLSRPRTLFHKVPF